MRPSQLCVSEVGLNPLGGSQHMYHLGIERGQNSVHHLSLGITGQLGHGVVLHLKELVTDLSQGPGISKWGCFLFLSAQLPGPWLQVLWMKVSRTIYSVDWQTTAHGPNRAQRLISKVLLEHSHCPSTYTVHSFSPALQLQP